MAGWHRILVYDEQGTFVRHISRNGEGPCEFGQLWWAQAYRGDSIAAFDMAKETIVVLGQDGGCARTMFLLENSHHEPDRVKDSPTERARVSAQ